MEIKLVTAKPCPFCGQQPMLKNNHVSVGCDNPVCGVNPTTDLCATADMAVALWDNRPLEMSDKGDGHEG